nr:vacuolar protein sorting-associated protein 13C-like [Onthophagus taurus]
MNREVIIEPVNLNMDIKRFTPSQNSSIRSQCWEIDGIMDVIQITLGQRDLAIILAIYADNIGEGKLLDLFPVPIIRSPTGNVQESDETVRTLEAFFCEPKQKYINTKFSFDGVSLLLFFDSGELLSSPIRDLNHGLCKFEIVEVTTCCVLYTDGSIDGKLSVDGLCIEEIGPDVNVYDKGILQSPVDDNKNNNCNITVNKPPIIDLTFHQTKNSDKSIDIIIGRLSLTLSVPFSEKMAMFIVDCLPKDTLDIGIINHGYVSDQTNENEIPKAIPHSLTIALRINRPEFIFVVETTSNKRRYFITKTEILSDYSRHGTRLSLVISLSGLHSSFYDVGIHAMEPYSILKQCDVELSKSFSEEKGDKITTSVSSIHIQLCNRVVYAINDILNDIVEHFKLPDEVPGNKLKRLESKEKEIEDLWEPKHLNEYVCKEEFVEKPPSHIYRELFLLPKTEMILILELEEIPVVLIKTSLEVTMCDWSTLLNSTCEFTIQANYFNDNSQCWEPVLDPIVMDDYEYKPWEVIIKIFQDKSLPMMGNVETKSKKSSNLKDAGNKKNSSPSSSDEESGEDMIYLQPSNSFHTRSNRKVKTSLSTFLDDSDSENEDGTMEKLAAAISDLFTGDWNESEASDSDHSSEGDEDDSDEEEVKPKHPDAYPQKNYKKSTYFLIDAKDILNITVTSTFFKVLNELFTVYSNKTLSITYDKSINIVNDIGPLTKVELFENKGTKSVENSTLVCSKTYEMQDSCPNSPTKSVYLSTDFLDDLDDRDSYTDETNKDIEMNIDLEPISSLEFPIDTTSNLYEKINKHHLKIHVPGFQPVQTCCPKKSWEKLMRLHGVSTSKIYYLLAKHSVNKHGRQVAVSSPLQIKNETCFALSILYQPSVLQQMNLEPVGDVMNPFETTMRIAVLEPHERYNVPLYIAYHCKLFIQPAYAEGHYVSDAGIWWQDFTTELDTAHNFHCSPKTDSNLEVFSLRVILRKHIDTKKSQSHFIPNYVIHLLPPLIVHNYLPYTLEVENIDLKQHLKVEPGEKSSAYSLNLSKDQKLLVKVCGATLNWSGVLNLTTHLDEKILHLGADVKEDGNGGNKSLMVHVKTDREGSVEMFFFSPYWIVNKTGLPLYIKASSSNVVYESTIGQEILLFSYKRHGKQSLNLKVFESDWSNDFGIECAGTTGLIVCKDNQRKKKYAILMSIHLSQIAPKHTKIITFYPNFLIINNTLKTLRFMEENEKSDLWIDLPPSQCVPFWPETTSMQMFVKYRDSKLKSQGFFISTNHHTVLRMDKGTAICVDVTGGKTESFKICFNEYKDGDAPVYIKNLCGDLFLKIQQQGQRQVTLLNPYHSMVYTWDDPTKPRMMLWNVYNNRGVGFNIDVSKDCYGEEKISFHSVTYGANQNQLKSESSSSEDSDSCDSVKTTLNKKVRKDKVIIYYICYRDGLKKILIFTQDQKVYNDILKDAFMEQCDFECLLSLAGIGVSFFTTTQPTKEHIYLSMADSPAIWEVNVGHKWKTLTLELASWIEDKYRLPYKKCQLKDYVHIDFEKMFMLKPFFAELKRTYNPALYVQFRKSQTYQYFCAKIQSGQIDNKQPTTSNDPITLNPMPCEAIKANSVIEFSFFKNVAKTMSVYKNVQLVFGDFYVNLEGGLVMELAKLMTEHKKWIQDGAVAFRNDLSSIRVPVTVINKDLITPNSLVENLTMSQIGIKLNISHKNQNNCNGYPFTKLLDFIFPANLSPYMPNEGVRHKISAFELIDTRITFFGMLSEIWNHFSTQFLEQYYSQVLGQHVLVNPYSIQAIPSHEKSQNEFDKTSSIILFGCRCFLGHVNMSSVALEQCIVDIFANQNIENIQRFRRHNSYHKPSCIPKCITSSSKNFNPGVILALEQIIIRNQSGGLQCDGEIFFKSTGKALHSLITRHPDDKSNCVQVAVEALRRAANLGEPVRIHQRLTRYFNNYLGLKPFSAYESMGHYLLETICTNRFKNDTYWAHCALDRVGKSIVLVSLEHVIRANKCRMWGSWELEWVLDLDEVVSVPQLIGNELIFNIRQGDVTFENSYSDNKLTLTGHKVMLQWLQEKIEQAIVVSMEEKSWTATEN